MPCSLESSHFADVCVETDGTLKVLFYQNGTTPNSQDVMLTVPDWDGSKQTTNFEHNLGNVDDCTNSYDVSISVTDLGTGNVLIEVVYSMLDCNNFSAPNSTFYGCGNPAIFSDSYVVPLDSGVACPV